MFPRRTAILCFGEALIDLLALPADGGPRRFAEHPGGGPANVAVGISRLGGNAGFAGMLSADMFGDVLLSQFGAFGVDTAQVRRTDEARTALAFVSLDDQGERSFNFYRPPSADLLFRYQDFDPSAFERLAVFHACSNSLTESGIAGATIDGMKLASRMGAVVSFDLNFRPMLWPVQADPRTAVWDALALAHVVKLSSEELEYLARGTSASRIVERLLASEARVVVVTDGALPMRWWSRSGAGEAPTPRVTSIDTTAAGDAFVAGLLHGLVRAGIGIDELGAAFDDGARREALLGFAAAVGALATTRHGAFAAMPSEAEVLSLIGASRHP